MPESSLVGTRVTWTPCCEQFGFWPKPLTRWTLIAARPRFSPLRRCPTRSIVPASTSTAFSGDRCHEGTDRPIQLTPIHDPSQQRPFARNTSRLCNLDPCPTRAPCRSCDPGGPFLPAPPPRTIALVACTSSPPPRIPSDTAMLRSPSLPVVPSCSVDVSRGLTYRSCRQSRAGPRNHDIVSPLPLPSRDPPACNVRRCMLG